MEDPTEVSFSAGGLGAAPSLQPPSSEAQHPPEPGPTVQQPERPQAAQSPPEVLQREQQQGQQQEQQEQQTEQQPQEQVANAQIKEQQLASAAQADAAAAAAASLAAAADPGTIDSPFALVAAAANGTATAAASGATDGTAGGAGIAGAASEAVEDEDELAANLLSNMSAWQSELDSFQAALRRVMETPATPAVPPASPAMGESSGGSGRLQHNGPKGITGFRGVTQHKCVRLLVWVAPWAAAPLLQCGRGPAAAAGRLGVHVGVLEGAKTACSLASAAACPLPIAGAPNATRPTFGWITSRCIWVGGGVQAQPCVPALGAWGRCGGLKLHAQESVNAYRSIHVRT